MPTQHSDGVTTAANVNASNPVPVRRNTSFRVRRLPVDRLRVQNATVSPLRQGHLQLPYATNAGSQTAARNEVPRPPYAGGSAPTSANKAEHNNQAVHQSQPTSSAPQTRAPAPQSSPAATHSQRPTQNNRESTPKSSANPGTAAVSTPVLHLGTATSRRRRIQRIRTPALVAIAAAVTATRPLLHRMYRTVAAMEGRHRATNPPPAIAHTRAPRPRRTIRRRRTPAEAIREAVGVAAQIRPAEVVPIIVDRGHSAA